MFLQPIYFGAPRDNVVLGVLAVGFEVGKPLAEAVARVASAKWHFATERKPLSARSCPFKKGS